MTTKKQVSKKEKNKITNPKIPKKKKVVKDITNIRNPHENDKCSTCKHERIYHYGINGICYHPNCKCYKFRQNEIIL